MEKKIRVGIVQQANTDNIKENMQRLKAGIEACARQGAQLVVLQELHNTLYFCQTENTACFDMAESIPGASTDFYGDIARAAGVVLVTSLFERRTAGVYHNTAVLVCWDQWYPEAARMMALQDADLLIYPTAIGWESSDTPEEQARQREAWITVQRGHAIANGLPVVAVNRVGHESDPSGQTNGIQFWGSSFVAGAQGEMVWQAADREECAHVADIDLARSEQVRRWWPFLRDRRIDAYQEITERFID